VPTELLGDDFVFSKVLWKLFSLYVTKSLDFSFNDLYSTLSKLLLSAGSSVIIAPLLIFSESVDNDSGIEADIVLILFLITPFDGNITNELGTEIKNTLVREYSI
jgi:hypothetical protein